MRGIGKVKPDATGSGAKVRQPESPQEADLLYTRRSPPAGPGEGTFGRPAQDPP